MSSGVTALSYLPWPHKDMQICFGRTKLTGERVPGRLQRHPHTWQLQSLVVWQQYSALVQLRSMRVPCVLPQSETGTEIRRYLHTCTLATRPGSTHVKFALMFYFCHGKYS
jgi:hypothetical protein